jgi:hypothetical protein
MGTLSESRLISSTNALKKYDAEHLADLAVLYVCAIYILYCTNSTKHFAEKYARRTIQYGTQFNQWHTGATDLYAILFGLTAEHIKLDNQEESDHFKSILPFGETLLVRWLRELNNSHLHSATHRSLFTRLDFNFKIKNSSIRAIRRLVMEWDDLDHHEQKLAMTRLLQLMRNRAQKSELLSELQNMADQHELEIEDACDKETGRGCATVTNLTVNPIAKKSGGSLMATLAGAAAAIAIRNIIDRKKA